MMSSSSSKHLRELLTEDQEPFVLKNYIDEKRCEIKRSVSKSKSSLQIKRRNHISENSSFCPNFCKNVCLFSSPNKSPLFDFCSPAKSPCRNSNSNTLFVQIPARTAALLLEAALRIQNANTQKVKCRKSVGFGVFGSILKRLGTRKRNQKTGEENKLWGSSKSAERIVRLEENAICEMGFSCSSNSRRTSVWSESNEDKSLDLETSSSRSEDDSEEMEFLLEKSKISDFDSCDKGFCSSPFRFVLQNSELKTPLASPIRQKQQVVDNEEGNLNGAEKEHEDDKEQNSPVSVLDPPFEDDDDDEGHEDEMENEQDEVEVERSFASVQRAKQHLFHKLRRFERLAELDPVELEKRITEQEDEDYNDDDSVLSDTEETDYVFIRQILQQSNNFLYDQNEKIPSDIQRLVLDLVVEEAGKVTESYDRELVAKKVSKRLESWKEVDSNTIDMMVESDFKRDSGEWMKNPEQMQETAAAIELAIFGFLVDEFSNELTYSGRLV